MKKMNSPTKTLISAAIFTLFLLGCSNNETAEIDEQELQQDLSELVMSSEIDASSEAADDIALDVYETQEQSEFGRTPPHFDLPDCVTITVIIEESSRLITIDFGTEGCVIRGNTLKGIINLSYVHDPDAQQVLITKVLSDFYFNDKNIIGEKSFLKELSNDNGNPQFTKTVDIIVVWPDGTEASRTGTKVREWIEGHGSGIFSDNVFEITGSWTSIFRDGNTHSHEVVLPLRREVICRYFVSGTVEIEHTNFSGVLDFGEGDCDNLATFTNEDGEVREIILN